jgi:uncharacterized protein YbcC (UPF0753/DUF2309 family)
MNGASAQHEEFLEFAPLVDAAVRAIPPVWPLASSVAVNPFLGQAGESLVQTAARLGRVAGTAVTMPRAWYLERIESRDIAQVDLERALAAAPGGVRPASVAALLEAARRPAERPAALPTVADLAAKKSGTDWAGVIAERLGSWASGYFDMGQAIWGAPRGKGTYAAWRAVAMHDLTPEILGLAGFAVHVSEAPETPSGAISRVVRILGLDRQALPTYFHRLLMGLGGWASYARYQLWQAELAGETDTTLAELLAIRLVWEEALYERYGDGISERWSEARAAYAAPVEPTPSQVIDVILQEAAEHAAQRALAKVLNAPAGAPAGAPDNSGRPALQAVFCIDVRSEVFRRALETTSPQIQTLGFAGFFGLGAAHRRFASDVTELRLPVLLNPGISTVAGGPDDAPADQSARFKARAKRAWGRFKLAAVSSFAFVEATGPIYVGKLLRDALALDHGPVNDDPPPRLDPPLDLESRAQAAETVLRAMSLTGNFARLVILAGHGATVVNNPHASSLHCGACGGYPGDANARLLAALLNSEDVREQLAARGIVIPADTLFLGALHDTTTDAVMLYTQDRDTAAHSADLSQATAWLDAAGALTRTERARRLPHAHSERRIRLRSRDWSEVRPEWALAGCQAFIAAPRHRTSGRDLQGRAFLHDYDWAQDEGFGVLELIMTAPVVVASWISLQYYGSTVAPEVFGGGNKLLHNVTGGIGVIEGNGGVLRAGLPWQSIHNGERYEHEPLRLAVCIEAPQKAMTDILRKHAGIRALFDNRWLYLFALDDAGCMAARYAGDLAWTSLMPQSTSIPVSNRRTAVS